MRIVSLNAWGGQVWGALSDWLGGLRPDVLCLQEVTRAPAPAPDCPGWLRYEDAHRRLDQRADLFADVSRLLPDHQPCFAPAARGTLRDGAGRAVLSEHGIAMWVRRDLAIAGVRQEYVHGAFRVGGWGPEPVPRTMQAMRIADPQGRTRCIAHLHGLRDPAGKMDTPARAAQAARILALLDGFRHPEEPVVLAGDLNVLPGSATLKTLTGAGLVDLIARHGVTDTRTALYAKAQRHADYMLVSPDLADADFSVPAAPVVSDHRPMILQTG